jgi:TonB family protein
VNVAFPRFLYMSVALHLIGLGLIFHGVFSREVRPFPVIYSVRIVEEPASVTAPAATVGRERLGSHVPDVFGKAEMPSREARIEEELPVSPAPAPETKKEPSVSGEAALPAPGVPEAQESPLLGRKKLFDRDILRMIAQTEKPPAHKEGITFDTEEYRYRKYLQRLKETIESIWIYPREAAEKGIFGDLFVRFVIKKDGRLGEVKVVRTSGHSVLDSAAVKALRDAEPFWPLPEEWGGDALTITGHFIYTVYGMEIR